MSTVRTDVDVITVIERMDTAASRALFHGLEGKSSFIALDDLGGWQDDLTNLIACTLMVNKGSWTEFRYS